MPDDTQTLLLIIDAQFDFCSPQGALFVPGAEQDVERLGTLIDRCGERIDHIIATLDTHRVLDIAHPGYWADSGGQPPAPFTPISLADVSAGRWTPRFDGDYVRNYLARLEEQGEFQHFIWPEHCLAGSRGAALAEPLADALRRWSHRARKNYRTVPKGEHPLAEHFGVFRAQVPVPGAAETELNQALLDELAQFDEIWLAGEARSHCVATSLNQLLRHAPDLAARTVLLTDCTSDVAGLGHLADPIYEKAAQMGVRFVRSSELSA